MRQFNSTEDSSSHQSHHAYNYVNSRHNSRSSVRSNSPVYPTAYTTQHHLVYPPQPPSSILSGNQQNCFPFQQVENATYSNRHGNRSPTSDSHSAGYGQHHFPYDETTTVPMRESSPPHRVVYHPTHPQEMASPQVFPPSSATTLGTTTSSTTASNNLTTSPPYCLTKWIQGEAVTLNSSGVHLPLVAMNRKSSLRSEEDMRSIHMLLQSIPLLTEALPKEQLYAMAAIVYYQYFPSSDTVVFQRGDAIVNFYILLEGAVLETGGSSAPGVARITRHGPGGGSALRQQNFFPEGGSSPNPRQQAYNVMDTLTETVAPLAAGYHNHLLLTADGERSCQIHLSGGTVFGFENPLTYWDEQICHLYPTSRANDNTFPALLCPQQQQQSQNYSSYQSGEPVLLARGLSHKFETVHRGYQRQNTVVTKSSCHVIYANWWEFIHLFLPSSSNAPLSDRYLNTHKDQLSVAFQVFSDRTNFSIDRHPSLDAGRARSAPSPVPVNQYDDYSPAQVPYGRPGYGSVVSPQHGYSPRSRTPSPPYRDILQSPIEPPHFNLHQRNNKARSSSDRRFSREPSPSHSFEYPSPEIRRHRSLRHPHKVKGHSVTRPPITNSPPKTGTPREEYTEASEEDLHRPPPSSARRPPHHHRQRVEPTDPEPPLQSSIPPHPHEKSSGRRNNHQRNMDASPTTSIQSSVSAPQPPVVPVAKVSQPQVTVEDNNLPLFSESGSMETVNDVSTLSIGDTSPQATNASQDQSSVQDSAVKIYQSLLLDTRSHVLQKPNVGLTQIQWSGAELIKWLSRTARSEDRVLLKGVWQILIDENLLLPANKSLEMRDRDDFFCFFSPTVIQQSSGAPRDAEALNLAITNLLKYSPDAVFRVILQRSPKERSQEELDFVYNESMNLKALSHLSNMVKRQLASVFELEVHVDSVGKALFRQGDEGTYWYIVLRGAVDVHIAGKGVVCTLKEGDDFGKLALINNAPRAATIILKERVCHFLKVCKEDFDRILLDVEANTVRLKEHGKDVLILARTDPSNHQNYSIISGTLDKITEYILDSRIHPDKEFDSVMELITSSGTPVDVTVRDFFYSYPIFATTRQLVDILQHYFIPGSNPQQGGDVKSANLLKKQQSTILFLCKWFKLLSQQFAEEELLESLIEKCEESLSQASSREKRALQSLVEQSQYIRRTFQGRRQDVRNRASIAARGGSTAGTGGETTKPISETDPLTLDIYFPDKNRHQITVSANASVQSIVKAVLEQSDFQKMENPRLCEVKSSGEIVVFKNSDLGVSFRIGHNSRLFVASSNELKELTPLPQQLISVDSNANYLELVNVEEFAMTFCHYDWEQLMNIRTHELIYATFGRDNFGKITPNLDFMVRRFTRVQYWVVTEVVLAQNMHKRATLLRKIIKLAFTLLQMKNLNTFIAIVMGLSHSAVSRLRHTWDKVPTKQQKLFKEFSALLDPSRNHRILRQKVLSIRPPFVPFMALLLKDITFIHEGNQSRVEEESLINFEKVQLLGKTIAYFEEARSVTSGPFLGPQKRDRNYEDMRHFVENLACLEDQRRLTNLSLKLEGKR